MKIKKKNILFPRSSISRALNKRAKLVRNSLMKDAGVNQARGLTRVRAAACNKVIWGVGDDLLLPWGWCLLVVPTDGTHRARILSRSPLQPRAQNTRPSPTSRESSLIAPWTGETQGDQIIQLKVSYIKIYKTSRVIFHSADIPWYYSLNTIFYYIKFEWSYFCKNLLLSDIDKPSIWLTNRRTHLFHLPLCQLGFSQSPPELSRNCWWSVVATNVFPPGERQNSLESRPSQSAFSQSLTDERPREARRVNPVRWLRESERSLASTGWWIRLNGISTVWDVILTNGFVVNWEILTYRVSDVMTSSESDLYGVF